MNSTLKKTIQFVLSPKAWSVDTGLLLLRLSCALMLLHGWPKFVNFSKDSADWPDPFHIGSTASYAFTVFAELFCTLFVVIGLFTRAALMPLIAVFIVIIFHVHSQDPITDKEHGLLYLMSYLTLLFTGPGKYSIDALVRKN